MFYRFATMKPTIKLIMIWWGLMRSRSSIILILSKSSISVSSSIMRNNGTIAGKD